jgi:hypothetical protein
MSQRNPRNKAGEQGAMVSRTGYLLASALGFKPPRHQNYSWCPDKFRLWSDAPGAATKNWLFRRQAQFDFECSQTHLIDDPAQALLLIPVFIPVQYLRCQPEDLRVRQVGGDEVRQPGFEA